MIMRFVITGCARSGTKYTSHMLTYGGMLCGHEDVFNRWEPDGTMPEGWAEAPYDGDSSYVAAPAAAALAEAGLTVVHLVRPPLDTIASIVTMGWLGDLTMPYVAYTAAHLPAITEQPPGPCRAAAYWLGWNRLVEPHAHLTWRTGEVDVDDVRALAGLADRKITITRVREALARVSPTTNHKRTTTPVDLGALGPLAGEVEADAAAYGVPLSAAADSTASA